MYRQYSSQNQRNIGIKIKHVPQISLFLAICFWLVYQMKHSHDKNSEFEEDDARGSMERASIGGYIKIGRKDIRPLYDENKPYNETNEEQIGEEIEYNHEEDMSLDKNAEEENEASRYEDVVEKFDTEVDQEEEAKKMLLMVKLKEKLVMMGMAESRRILMRATTRETSDDECCKCHNQQFGEGSVSEQHIVRST